MRVIQDKILEGHGSEKALQLELYKLNVYGMFHVTIAEISSLIGDFW